MKVHKTYEDVLKAAKCYKTKMDFKKNDRSNYNFAVYHKLLDKVCEHMNGVGDMFKRCIYVYEFPNKVCYIGLTFNLEKRHNEHLTNSCSSVYRYSFEEKVKTPTPIKLTEYIDKDTAAKLEGEFLEKYKENGWTILNRKKTGGLGGSRKVIRGKNIDIGLCKTIAMECETPTEFQKKYYSIYKFSKQRGWLEYIFSHFDKEEISRKGHKIIGEKHRNKKINVTKMKESAYSRNINKSVLQYDLNGVLINEYKSQKEAAIILGKPNSHGNIGKCCKGKLKTCLGFVWKYK